MVVKSERGRRRYVYLRVPADIRRDGLAELLSDIASVKVITCSSGDAVVRCDPADRESVIAAVESRGGEAVLTSGTLRTLRDRYPALKVPRRRKRRSGAAGVP